MISYEICIEIQGFTAQQRIRNMLSQVVRSALLHLSSSAGPTGNSEDSEISHDLSIVFEIFKVSNSFQECKSDLCMVVRSSKVLLAQKDLQSLFQTSGKTKQIFLTTRTKNSRFRKFPETLEFSLKP